MGFGKSSIDSEEFVVGISRQESPKSLSLRELVDEIVQREKQILFLDELKDLNPKKSPEYNQVKTSINNGLKLLYDEIEVRDY